MFLLSSKVSTSKWILTKIWKVLSEQCTAAENGTTKGNCRNFSKSSPWVNVLTFEAGWSWRQTRASRCAERSRFPLRSPHLKDKQHIWKWTFILSTSDIVITQKTFASQHLSPTVRSMLRKRKEKWATAGPETSGEGLENSVTVFEGDYNWIHPVSWLTDNIISNYFQNQLAIDVTVF